MKLKRFIKCLAVFAAALTAISLPTPISLSASGFSDVAEDDWFTSDVNEMSELGYIKGYEDNTFRPNGTITNAELASI